MAELYFKVGSDWQEVVKLRMEIAKLETQLASMGSNTDPMNIKRLESQLASAKSRFEELTAAAAIAASQIKDSMATVDLSAAMKQIRDFDTQIQSAVGSLDSYFTALRSKMQGALSSMQIGDIQIGNVEVPNADTSQVGELRRLYSELAEQIRQQSAEVEAQHQKWLQLAESIRTNNVTAIRQLAQEFASIGKVDLGVSGGSTADTGAKFDNLSAKIQKAKQDVDALQVTVDKLWQLVRNGNTNITIGVQADFDKIQKLYDDISKLETKVKDMDWGADPLHIKELCNQIKTSSEQIKTAVDELTRKTATLGSSVSAIGAGHTQLRQLDQQLTNTRSGFGGLSKAAGVAALTMERDGSAAAMALSGALNRVYGDAMMLTTTLLGGLGLEQLIVTVATTRSQFQQLEMSFNTMLGSAEKAQALTTQLVATAAKTPFDMTSITQGAKQLLAYGTQAEEVNDILVHLGDIAAGLSLPLGDLVYLYGTTMAQGRMFTMDLRQFMGRGIPMAEALAKQFGVSANEVGKLVTEGKVTADVFKKAILEMSSEGGRFGGLMEKQAATIGGRWSNIGDSVQQMFNEIGKASEGAIGAGLDIVSDLVENWRTVGKFILSAAAAFGAWKTATNVGAGIQSMMQNANKAQQLAALDAEIAKMRELIQQRQTDSKATLEQQVATGQLTQAQAEEIARRQQLLDEMRQQAGMRTAEEAAQMEAQNAANRRSLEETLAVGQQLVGIYKQEYDEKAKGLALAEEVKRKADERVQSALEYLEAEKEIAATQGSSQANVNEAQADYDAAIAEQVAAAKELKAAQEEADAAATNLNSMAEEVNTLQQELNTTATGANTASTTANTTAENVNTAATTRNTATTTGNTIALRLHTVGTKMAAAGQKILTSAVNFTEAAFQRLKLAIVTNPIGAVLTAISAAIPFFLDFGDSTESAAQASERFGKAAADEIDNANVLISTIQNVERTSNVYKQAQDELNKILAQYNIGLIDEKTTTEELIAKKKELVDAINKEAEARTKANAINDVREDYKSKQDDWYNDLYEELSDAEHYNSFWGLFFDSDKIQKNAKAFAAVMREKINAEIPKIMELDESARNQAIVNLRGELTKIMTDAGVSDYDASYIQGSYDFWNDNYRDALTEIIEDAIELREQFKENTDIVEQFGNKAVDTGKKVSLTLAEEYGNTAEEAKKLFDDFQVEQWGKSLMDATANADVLSRALPNIVPSDLDPDKAFDKLLLLEEACKNKIEEVSKQKYHVAVDYTTLYGLRNMLAAIQTQMKTVFSDFKGGEINLNTTNGMGDRIKEINKLMGDIDISTSEGKEKYAAYKKERDRIQKMLDDTTGKKTGGGKKYDPKAAAYSNKKLMQDYADDLSEFERDMQDRITNTRIQNMRESTEKELAQISQDAQREQKALDDRIKKLVEKKKKLDEQVWLNGGANRKRENYKPEKTDAQYRTEVMAEVAKDASGNVIMGEDGNPVTIGSMYDAQMMENDIKFQKRREEVRREELQSMRDYLREYGSFEQQRLAITQDYEERIKLAKTEGERLKLQKERDKALSSQSFESISMGIDWSALLNGVGNLSQEMLKPMLEQLQAYTKTDQFNQADIQEREKVVELINELKKYVGTDQNATWQQLSTAINNFTQAVGKYKEADAQEKLALQNLANARGKLERGEISQDDFDRIEREARELGARTVEAKDEMQQLGQTLNETSDEVKGYVSPLTTALQKMSAWQGVEGFSGLQNGVAQFDQLKGTLDSILPSMGDGMAKTIGSGLSSALGSGMSALGDGLSSVMSSGIGSIIGIVAQIPRMILQLADAIKNMVTGILDAITELLKFEWLSDLVNSILEAIGNLIDAIFDLPEHLFNAISSIVVDGIGGLVDGVLGRVGNVLSFGLLSSGGPSDWFTNSNAAEVAETTERLTEENEKLRNSIDGLCEEIKSDGGSKSIKSAQEALEANRQYIENQREILDAQQGYHSAHHSNAYYWDLGREHQNQVNALLAEYAKRNNKTASRVNSDWGTFAALSPEEMDYIRNHNLELWKQLEDIGKYDKSEFFEAFADLAGSEKEILDSLNEALTQTSFDSLKSNFISNLMDMERSAEDFSEDFTNMMMQAVLNARISDLMDKEIQDFYDKWAELSKDSSGNGYELTKTELDTLSKMWDDIINHGMQIRDEVAAVTGYDQTNADKQEADKKGFAGMSQDLGEELNGRFTAVQIAGENVSAQANAAMPLLAGMGASASRTADMVEGIGRVADDMLTNMVECYTELNLIRVNTDDMMPIMKANKTALEKIEKNTRNI